MFVLVSGTFFQGCGAGLVGGMMVWWGGWYGGVVVVGGVWCCWGGWYGVVGVCLVVSWSRVFEGL